MCVCRHLEEIAKTPGPLAVSMRMLEVYSSSDTYNNFIREDKAIQIIHNILNFLVRKGEQLPVIIINIIIVIEVYW